MNGLFFRTTWISRYQKGKTRLDSNEARDEWGLGLTVSSAGPHANKLHLATDRSPHQHLITQFYRPDAVPSDQPTVSKHERQVDHNNDKFVFFIWQFIV